MFNKKLLLQLLIQIDEALRSVQNRFEPIAAPEDFVNSPRGKEKLDAICMQLIAIGESLKNVDKYSDFELLVRYPKVDWTGAKGLRDIIAHHYFDIDAEEIFEICDVHIEPMQVAVKKMIVQLNVNSNDDKR